MAFGVLALVHTACENAKYDVIDNLVYINEASTSKTKELTLTEWYDAYFVNCTFGEYY
ncbi:hypothetical protein NXV53_14940 [Bacteroides faecis]|nr:hypothetical protein [Bacteroides faecis]MCS3325846.1 hypothetical protein [Bacteroides faecis]